ncbi:sulfatase-like hydrolase/transferase [Kiritimatiellaeota bacterium B1221]|nr:sulfatase-like hydrolase/transferase [Kiritimatiellaeota bacterium B1221]
MKNILILLADQHRADIMGHAGNPEVLTPHFDRMAREGFQFSNCLSSHPLCAPFRATLQTGRYPFTHGVVFNDDVIDYALPNLAGQFKSQGYATGFFGKGHWDRKIQPGYLNPDERLNWEHWVGWNNGHEDYDLPTFDEDDNPWLNAEPLAERPPHDNWGDFKHEYANLFAPGVQVEQLKTWVESLEPSRGWIAQVNWGPPHNISNVKGYRDPETLALSKEINQQLELGLEDVHFESYIPWLTTFPQYLVSPMVPQYFLDLYDAEKLTVPDNVPEKYHRLVQYQLKGYYAQVSALDALTGRTMDWLKQTGRDKDTILMYTSDHGDFLGSHANEEKVRKFGSGIRGKGSPHACNTRVPMILWSPENIQAGKCTDTPIGTVDLLPSICGLAGIPCPPSLPGKNLAAWGLRGEGLSSNPLLLTMLHWRARYDGQYMYGAHARDGELHPAWLYDFKNDPLNLSNLIDEPESQILRERLHQELLMQMAQEKDPFLTEAP